MRNVEPDKIELLLNRLRAAVAAELPDKSIFEKLHEGLTDTVGSRVSTVLKLEPATLRSVRLYSSEASYPVGVTKTARAERLERGRSRPASFPDSAAIEATGCGSVVAVPILSDERVVGTVNLWHEGGFYDLQKAERATPWAAAIAPLCSR
jgi:hypothetical protein